MLYPILVEYYVVFCISLLLLTWLCRLRTPRTGSNLLYLYGMIAALGFLLAQDWVAGVIFGLIVLELGRVFRKWLEKKRDALK